MAVLQPQPPKEAWGLTSQATTPDFNLLPASFLSAYLIVKAVSFMVVCS